MFTNKITESDAFLEMPLSTQCLYFHLNMYGDDDGFVNNPKKVVKIIGANDDDLKLLIMKSFVMVFESGVILIKHWRMHNTLRNDRYHPTDYQEEFAQVGIKSNNAYTWADKQIEHKRFQPPTLEEVEEYCRERHSSVDPKLFYEYFTTGKWKDSRGKQVKNWKQKLLTWENHRPKQEDKLPTYDTSKNKEMSKEEMDELLSLMGKGEQ